MAGSIEMFKYDRNEQEWPGLIENMGDAYEALEEYDDRLLVLEKAIKEYLDNQTTNQWVAHFKKALSD